MLHFTNGDAVREPLVRSGVPGHVIICADVLHEGPCQAGLDPAQWRELRANYLATAGYAPLDAIRRDFGARDEAIASAAKEDEVVLWFEHDLFDQLNLVWLLDALASQAVAIDRIRLIVIGEHPEISRFAGLGQLSAAQLAALFPSRVPLTHGALTEAREAWGDVCRPNPEALLHRAQAPSVHWRWLPGALLRLVEELPAVHGGLSRTEAQGLAAIAAGARTMGDAFRGCAAREERVFLGDLSFYGTMTRLSSARVPLVSIDAIPEAPLHQWPVALTAVGREVLTAVRDHAALNGLDRWVGGVHLVGREPGWRWDGQRVRSV